MDVETTFLNGDLKEKIYMDQPKGFEVKGKETWYVNLSSLFMI